MIGVFGTKYRKTLQVRQAPRASPENQNYGIAGEMREVLLEASPAETDMLPKRARKAFEIRGVSTTRSFQTPLRSRIPVRKTVRYFRFDAAKECKAELRGRRAG
jgi:hypothetical protein